MLIQKYRLNPKKIISHFRIISRVSFNKVKSKEQKGIFNHLKSYPSEFKDQNNYINDTKKKVLLEHDTPARGK